VEQQPSPTRARTKARKAALDILFEADLRGLPIADVLVDADARGEPVVRPYTRALVTGVADDLEAIDESIAARLPDGWSLDRMPRVDRNLARLAACELQRGEVEPAIVISEAVTLAAALSTDDSPAFLNGVLSGVAAADAVDKVGGGCAAT